MKINQRLYELAAIATAPIEVLSGDELSAGERAYVFELSQYNPYKDSFRLICRENDQVLEWWREPDGTIYTQTRPVTEQERVEEIPAIA